MRLFLLTLFVVLAASAAAEDAFVLGDPIFTTVGDAESIPGLIVAAIAQDRHGLLWLGTHEGVIRYDGYEFRIFRHDPRDDTSLSDNVIRAIEPGDDGRIWIATNNGGVSILDPASGAVTRLQAGRGPRALTSNDARAFARGEGGMWVGTRSALHFVEYATLAVRREQAAPSGTLGTRRESIGALLRDRAGDLWIGSAGGLAVRRRNGTLEIPAVAAALSGKPINGLFEAKDGAIWISVFGGGLARLDRRAGELRLLSEQRSYSVAQPRDGEIWIGRSGEGIEVRDAATGEVRSTLRHDVAVRETIDGDRIGSLFVDRASVVWIGLWGRGLNRHIPSGAFRILPHSPTRPLSLTHPDVGCVFEARDGTLWIGTRGNGVDIVDRARGRIGDVRAGGANGLTDGDVPAITQTNDGAMWIGTATALHRFDPSDGTMKQYRIAPVGQPMGAIATLAPAEGGLWIGATGGLAQFDARTETATAARYEDGTAVGSQISAIVTDRRGILWVATQTGLAARLPGATRFRRFTRERNTGGTLSSNSILGLLVDRRGHVWAGTATGVDRLVRFDGTAARFEAIAPRVGRDGKRGENLLEDGAGRIWIDGETMFDPVTLEHRHFAPAEGAGRVVWRGAATVTRSGELIFGGPDGLLIARPNELANWSYDAPLVISDVRVDDVRQTIRSGESIELRPGNRSFAVDFAALDLSAPERNRYAHRLNGFDSKWIETDATRRTASYTALPPGRFVLEIRGSNRVGAWSSATIAVPIVVHPAIHQTVVFKALVAALTMLLLYLLYRGRVRYLEARRAELEEQVRARTVELDHVARTDFLTALSNRRDLFDQAASIAKAGAPFAVLLGDVDKFKRLNDELGHDAGDAALRHVAECLRAQTRANDVAARWGGEEFLVLMPHTDEQTAAQVAERIRQTLQGSAWTWDGRTRFITMSIGVAAARPQEALEETIRRADEALLGAKRDGRNRVVRALATA